MSIQEMRNVVSVPVSMRQRILVGYDMDPRPIGLPISIWTNTWSPWGMYNLFIIIFSFLIGLAGPLVALILRLIGEDLLNPNASLVIAAYIVELILRFVPAFNFGSGWFKSINVETYEYLAGKPITVWHHRVILNEVIFQCIWCFLYIALAMQNDGWSSNPRVVNILKCISLFKGTSR
jgi:hypothetical protein